MAVSKARQTNWGRQQTCPAVRSDRVDAYKRNDVNLADRKFAQSVKPLPLTTANGKPMRKPIPVPRDQEDCIYLADHEVHSPTLHRTDLTSRRAAPAIRAPPLGSYGAVSAESQDGSGSHYYKTLSEDHAPDDDGYDYTRFGPDPYAETTTGNGEEAGGYSEVVESSRSRPKPKKDTYDVSRGMQRSVSEGMYRELEARNEDEESSDEDYAYSQPRDMMSPIASSIMSSQRSASPPCFPAPTMTKSASTPAVSQVRPTHSKPPPPANKPRPNARKPIPIRSNGIPTPQDRQPQLPRKLSPGYALGSPNRLSPTTPHYEIQGPGELEVDEDDPEYHYPTVNRVALPYYRAPSSPRAANARKNYEHEATNSRQAPAGGVPLAGDEDDFDDGYVYNGPLESMQHRTTKPGKHTSQPTPNLPPKPAVNSKHQTPTQPQPPQSGRRPVPVAKRSPKPSPNGTRRQVVQDDEQDDEDYDKPVVSAAADETRNYKQLDDEPTSWYHGDITRIEAEGLLSPHPAGTYLLRDGKRHHGYSLSVSRGSEQCRHFQVCKRAGGRYKLGSFDREHKTIHQLILFFHQTEINEAGEKLSTPLRMK